MQLLNTSWARLALACSLLDRSLSAVMLGLALTAGIAVSLMVWH